MALWMVARAPHGSKFCDYRPRELPLVGCAIRHPTPRARRLIGCISAAILPYTIDGSRFYHPWFVICDLLLLLLDSGFTIVAELYDRHHV